MCTPIFIIVLFTIAKIWKSSKCSSMDEWRSKMWYIHTIEIRFKRKEILTHATTLTHLKDIMQSEIRDTKGQLQYDSTYIRYLR